VIQTKRLTIELIAPRHAAPMAAYYKRNAAHLKPWEPSPPEGLFEVAFHAERIPRDVAAARDDRMFRFIAFERTDDARERVAVSVNLSNVVRGVFQAAHLGYSIDASLQGRGLASEAVNAVVDYCFTTLHFHRLMANYNPTNERSGKLLRGLGFTVEGYARDYLYIDEAWRDSILTAKTNPDLAYVP